jgi:hypothetical protein
MDVGMGNARVDVGVFGAGHDGWLDGLLATRFSRLYDLLFPCLWRIHLAVLVLLRGYICGNFTHAVGVAE